MTHPAARAPWREPMLWLVAALPVLVLAAAVATVAVARQGRVDDSGAHTRRIAQVQIEDLAADREAARLGLRARVAADAARGVLIVDVRGAAGDGPLRLALLHPLDARADRTLALVATPDGWRGETAPWSRQAWDLRLSDPRGRWRLAGRLPASATQASLQPAVAP